MSRIDTSLAMAAVLLLAAGCASSHREPEQGKETHVHFGDQMERLGRRYERLGRAAESGRWDLARYELHEIHEGMEELKLAALPRDLGGTDLGQQAKAFIGQSLPTLDSALNRRDPTAFGAAFRQVARACKACHQSVGRGFIEVPDTPGAEIPALGPLPGEARR